MVHEHHGIKYKEIKRSRYKYELVSSYEIDSDLFFQDMAQIPVGGTKVYAIFAPEGKIAVAPGYAWDGPSGPTFDTENSMRASLIHDVLYQAMREGVIPLEPYRRHADDLFYDLCVEDGMSRFRAWYFWMAVRLFGQWAASPSGK